MNKKQNIISLFWQKNEEIIKEFYKSKEAYSFHEKSLSHILSNLFCAGPAYYYVIDQETFEIEFISPSVKEILGLDPAFLTFDDIVNRVHPDDLSFIRLAEEYNLKKMQELGPEIAFDTKISYCFRELTALNQYCLFQLQAISIRSHSEDNRPKILNVHTNISHLTSVNSYNLTLTGMNNNAFYLQFNLQSKLELSQGSPGFTARELEVAKLLALGLETNEIADRLYLSPHTVQTHRKKMMQKAKARNVIQLVNYFLHHGIL
ncbi:MAG TPA: LuxR C-terminal-related transcriptional regulator [Niabella sp.]|nr:LuxR C-terminal-related transcriptional regulator [Niabella sp.]